MSVLVAYVVLFQHLWDDNTQDQMNLTKMTI